jgi:hypothetical protein
VWYPLWFILLGVLAGLVIKVSIGRIAVLVVIGFFLSNLSMFILLSGAMKHGSVLRGISPTEVIAEVFVPSVLHLLV